VVPNVNFAEPYTQYPQPQQSVAIIGGYVARNAQNVAAIQANAAQLGEGNAILPMSLDAFTYWSRINSLEGMSNLTTRKGTTNKIINTNHRRRTRKIKEL
jgi:hypothetical protein